MNLPSDRYFELVKTREDYDKLVSSGMAWEVEPDCPSSWCEHLEMVKIKEGSNRHWQIADRFTVISYRIHQTIL